MIGLHICFPKNCFDSCPCLNEENGTCQADNQHRYVSVDRPSWCPLIDLATQEIAENANGKY